MKNIIIIDIDHSRPEKQVMIGKDIEPPEKMTKEEFVDSYTNDIKTILEGAIALIHAGEKTGIYNSPDILRFCINYLENGFARPTENASVNMRIKTN